MMEQRDQVEHVNQERLFATIMQSLAMILFDPEGNIIWANDKFSSAVGYAPDELKQMHHRQLCMADFHKSEAYKYFWKRLREGTPFQNKVERVKRDGTMICLDAMYVPIVGADGKVEHVIKIATDITDKEKVIKNSSEAFMTQVEEMTTNTEELHNAKQRSVDEMARLTDESKTMQENVKKIGSMAVAVKEVASQSNLLGLNASIEAARAGEHGKGFSVVAEEVRKMADNSKQSAENISAQLEQITH